MIKPMLAKVYDPNKAIPYPVFLQPKLDGFRCLAYMRGGVVECWSRPSRALPEGKRYETTGHIEHQLAEYMRDGDIFDGELYMHGASFSDVARSVKNIKKNFGDIEYHIYDVVRSGNTQERIQFIEERLPFHHMSYVVPVKTVQANSPEEMLMLTDIFVGQGYEGSIIRTRLGKYEQGKRSAGLLKVKKFDDGEFDIVYAHEGIGKERGLVIWECITKDGVKFRCRPEGSYTERKKLYDQRFSHIGKLLTVKYFGIGAQGAPRFPVGLRIREDI